MNATLKLVLLALPFVILSNPAIGKDDEKEIPKLAVRGEAELEKPADQLRLIIGVISEGPLATEVLEANARRMRDVIKAVEKAGLTKEEYQTGRFSVRPKYTRRPRTADPEWKPQIIGYEVSNSINIKTKKLDLAAKLIDASNQAGANSIDSIAFDLADRRMYRAEAIAEATRHAIADANILAESASLELVRIMSITLDSARPQPPAPMSKRMMMAGALAEATTPIEPGNVTIRASVKIVYEIAPKE